MIKPRPPVSEQGIAARLENWGACQRGRSGGGMVARESRRSSPYGGQGYQCMTNVICTMLRTAAKGPSGAPTVQGRLDFTDADLVNRAWQKCTVRHNLLLKNQYVYNKPPYLICREMTIKQWPAGAFKRELAEAQQALQKIIDELK